MANPPTKRISALDVLSVGEVVDADYMPMVDASVPATKRITFATLKSIAETALSAEISAAVTSAESAAANAVASSNVARFATVAAMEADNNDLIGYSGNGATLTVTAGSLIEIISNRYVYEVADSAATDHDTTTAGGVKLYFEWPGKLASLSAPDLPIGPISIPNTFNNTLNASIYWDGTKVQHIESPYDLIDFTNYTSCNHYYVNYAEGSDSNAGTSTGSGNSWKTFDYAIANATSPAVIHLEDDWVGYLSAAGTAGKVFSGKYKILGEGPSGRTRIVAMRESYDATHFGFTASGSDGAYVTTATTSSDRYRSQFDANYKDAKGFPRPLTLAASQAECESTPGTFYWDSAANDMYVHMWDGRIPDPADGWVYTRSAFRTEWQQALTTSAGVILGENLEFCSNTGTAALPAFRYRPQTTGSSNTAQFGLKNCLAYGSSSNGFEIYDGGVTVLENCHARYVRADGLNYHSFVTTGTDGEFITVYEHDCSAFDTGFSGFDDQPSLGTSSNGSTSHDSMHIMRTNTVAGYCNGAVIADVNGVHSLNFFVRAAQPGATASPKACFWHEKYLGAGTTKIMYLWGCSAHDDGDSNVSLLNNTAQSGGSSNNGEIRVKYWRGQTDGSVVGTIYDFDGN